MDARRYHERTRNTRESILHGRRPDLENRPSPFKEYPFETVPVPPWLERLLRYGAGMSKPPYRTYSSAGGLYPVEIYVALTDGVYHFHPGKLALRRLREIEIEEPFLMLTGILWRTAWKYDARGYRHLYWDAGTLLANLLALDSRLHVWTGFVDDEVIRLLGIDAHREATLALVSFGDGEPRLPAQRFDRARIDARPLSRSEVAFPHVFMTHENERLGSREEVEAWRIPHDPGDGRFRLEGIEEVLLARRSTRDFADEPIERDELVEILAGALAAVPADVPPVGETYLYVRAVAGLEPGKYRFRPPDEFEPVRLGNYTWQARLVCLEQDLAARAAATVFFVASLDEVIEKLGDRGYRWAQLEAGIRVGRVYLGAAARGLGATATTFYDDEVSGFFHLPLSTQPMLAAAVGKKK